MCKIVEAESPDGALTDRYMKAGAFTDCYFVDIPAEISLVQYIEAFYTTPLFRLERNILTLMARRPATDEDAVALALGSATAFSAWEVESRDSHQILLRDFTGKTGTWLMVQGAQTSGVASTRLFFGSVVVPKKVSARGEGDYGVLFSLLEPFHRVYSRALLKAACKKLYQKPG